MDKFKETLLLLDSNEFDENQKVSILLLVVQNLNIDTVSEMARKEGKTPSGIKVSNQYRKINIGKQTFAVKGLTQNNLPF